MGEQAQSRLVHLVDSSLHRLELGVDVLPELEQSPVEVAAQLGEQPPLEHRELALEASHRCTEAAESATVGSEVDQVERSVQPRVRLRLVAAGEEGVRGLGDLDQRQQFRPPDRDEIAGDRIVLLTQLREIDQCGRMVSGG